MKRRNAVALVAAISMTVTGPASAATITTGGSTGLQLLAQKLGNSYFVAKHIKVTVAGGGSGAGIKGAANGTFDIGDSSRDPKQGDPTGLSFTPISKEPFVVITNPKNPIKSLNPSQINGIFTGQITSWSQVGWKKGGAIKVFSRIATSGTLASFQKLFLGGAPVTSAAPALASNALDRAAVSHNASGISFVTYAYIVGQKVVRAQKVANVAATLKNIISGKYKFWNYQYFVTKGAPSGLVAKYVNWVRSAFGAKVIRPFAVPTRDAAVTT